MNPKKAPRKIPRSEWKLPPLCLVCRAKDSYKLLSIPAMQEIRGEEVHYQTDKYVCNACEAALMSPAQATRSVKNAVVAYQQERGLLTGQEVASARNAAKMSAQEFADEAGCGIATVKRVEAGVTVLSSGSERLIRELISKLNPDEEEMEIVFSKSYIITCDNYAESLHSTCNLAAKSIPKILVNGRETKQNFSTQTLQMCA